MADIGKRNLLVVTRLASPGAYLDGGAHGEILLPNRYVPRRTLAGDSLQVFVYRDSSDRLVATTEFPRAEVGEIAPLKVISVNPRLGAFLDWGLPKDLLLPFREQTAPVRPGQQVTVRIYLDEKTDRIVASMNLEPEDTREAPPFRPGQSVEFVLIDEMDLGYQALIEGKYKGLLYRDTLNTPVRVGQTLEGYIRTVRDDGKIDLSLTAAGFQRVAPLAQKILKALQANQGRLPLDDNSSPAEIRERLGASKKAFKQALGTLYKARRIRFCHPGIELLEDSQWSPGEEPKPVRLTRGGKTR